MKGGIPAVVRHYPGSACGMTANARPHLRGSSWRSALGLEDARTVFARYKAIRRAERLPAGVRRSAAGVRRPGGVKRTRRFRQNVPR
jgi:hypothetical protein